MILRYALASRAHGISIDGPCADNIESQVYMFRLLLEYARIIDDNRAHIGYSGDGSELDKYDVTRRMVE